jgi:leucyl-tRNA synthetase
LSNSKNIYDHIKIETHWQEKWDNLNCFKVEGAKNPYYVLEMFPYPSGRIHMGHVRVYTLGDVLARYKRMQGFDVLHPMGWDAFGMPAENAAIENGIHPRDWTEQNISNMKEQLKSMGISYDWDREISTCDESYIVQQQKLFIKLFKANLIYKKKSWANWDPVEKSVLANEQVIEGKGWRSGALVEKKLLNQWFLAITKFAEPLLESLDELKEWPEKVKIMQKNWIGKSIGANLSFKLKKDNLINISTKYIEVFTTRPDTIFGASFLAIAPDHLIANELSEKSNEIADFIKDCQKSFLNEAHLEKSPKNGFFSGLYVEHPFLDQKIPVYIANFVLSSYGTGAIFGVPAHDQRDFDFATKYNLEIKQVVKPSNPSGSGVLQEAYTGDGVLYNSAFLDNLSVEEAKKEIIKRIEEKKIGKKDIKYRLRDWCASRQRYWGCPIPIIYREDGEVLPVDEKELPVTLPKDIDFSKGGNPLENHPSWKHTICKNTGMKAIRETDTLDTFFDSSWYYLRFLSPQDSEPFNKEETKQWVPVHQYVGGIEHAVLHLLYSRFVIKALKSIGELNINEPFKGLFCQGMVCHNTYKDEDGKWVFPENIVKKNNILIDVTTEKKVKLVRSEKMSKSKKNIVDPVNIIKKYGADTARLFMLSDSPPERNLDWSNNGIEGAKKFINKIWTYIQELDISNSLTASEIKDASAISLKKELNNCIYKVTKCLDNFQYNVAVASLREFSNIFLNIKKVNNNKDLSTVLYESLTKWIIMISPMIPHLAEELWKMLGYKSMVVEQSWPEFDTTLLENTSVKLVVQINGKKKLILSIEKGLGEEQTKKIVIDEIENKSILKQINIKKIIIIPDRVVNLVV